MRHASRAMAMAGGWYLLVGLAAFGRLALAFGRLGNIGPRVAVASGGLGARSIVIAKLPGGLFREARPMLNNLRASLECAAACLLDVLCFTARLLVGAKILGIELGFGEGVLLAVVAIFAWFGAVRSSWLPRGRRCCARRCDWRHRSRSARSTFAFGFRRRSGRLRPVGAGPFGALAPPHFKRVQSNAC